MWVLETTTLLIFAHIIIMCVGEIILIPDPPNEDEQLPCDTMEFLNLDRCCKTPQIFPKSTLIHCIEKMGTIKPNETLHDFQEFGGGYAVPIAIFSGIGGPMVIIECMFRNHSLLSTTPNKTMDMVKIQEKFQDVNDSMWSPVIKNAVETCTFDMMNHNMTNIPETEFAMMGPTYFMACIRRFLSLNCPKSIMEKADASCIETIRAVSSCHPFSVEVGNLGGPRGWIGSLLRWLAGSQTFVTQKETSRITFPDYL